MAEKKPVQQAVPTEAETDAHVDDLVNKALKALEEFEDFTQEQVDYIVAKCSVAGLDHHGILAEAPVKETGRGVFEDKAINDLKITVEVGLVVGTIPQTTPTGSAISVIPVNGSSLMIPTVFK